jgi:hypothetical protein
MRAPVALFLVAATMIGGIAVAADPAQTRQTSPSAEPKKEKTNFLNADNGLGAAALGQIGLTVGAMAFAGPQQWYGYPHEDGIPFTNDTAAQPMGDCATSDGSNVAKALMAQNDEPEKASPPEGVLRMTDAERQSAATAFDSKAIYQAGQPASCNEN